MKRAFSIVAAALVSAVLAGCARQSIIERHYYQPTDTTVLKREDGLSVGAVQVEIIKSGSPDWSDSKSISLISVGK